MSSFVLKILRKYCGNLSHCQKKDMVVNCESVKIIHFIWKSDCIITKMYLIFLNIKCMCSSFPSFCVASQCC